MGTISRRIFLQVAGSFAFSQSVWAKDRGVLVNDLHSQLNQTQVGKILEVDSLARLKSAIEYASKQRRSVSICGGRHAGGAQQFGTDMVLVDTTKLNRVLSFDQKNGLLQVESGIRWTELLRHLEQTQINVVSPWGIRQKQTGTDLLTIGGTLSANAHGQGLSYKPFIGDVEAFLLLDANGVMHNCSRNENTELFRLAIGGYGLFGVIYSVTLRLVPRKKVERIVEEMDIDRVIPAMQKAVSLGYPYGDFQFNMDERSDGYLKQGIFSSYKPAAVSAVLAATDIHLRERVWLDFAYGVHVNKGDTFAKYVEYYKKTSGDVNWSDVWQASTYIENYHKIIDSRLHSPHAATEVLAEIYVPKESLSKFIQDVRQDFLKYKVNLIYSTVQFIERDDESFLPWAKESYACVIFNLHTVHTPEGIESSVRAFRHLIDLAIKYSGSYYLTYHKFAQREQILACYPQFLAFLQLKLKHDPDERFQSDWYRHHKKMFD